MRKCKDWLTSYMEYTENSEPPDIFHKWVGISVIASGLQRKCYINFDIITFYPNLYIILIAPPGQAAKGTALAYGYSLLSDPAINIKRAADAGSRAAMIRRFISSADTFITPKGEMLLHSSMTAISRELTVLMGHQDLVLIDSLLDWYDCPKEWPYETVSRSLEMINNVYLNLIGCTTPALIQSVLPPGASGSGLISRIMFIYADRIRKKVMFPVLTAEQRIIRDNLLHDLDAITQLYGEFRFSEKGAKRYTDWRLYEEDEHSFEDIRFADYWSRRKSTLLKLSMICCASRTEDMIIVEEDVDRAIALVKEAERRMPMSLSGFGRSQQSDILSDIMLHIGRKGKTTVTALLRIFSSDLSKWELDRVLETLVTMKFCRITPNSGIIEYNHAYYNGQDKNSIGS